ncbi:MAG TPA: RDD family protein [Verrucomicrobiota bacterium]|nr:RDD family protein [Verrucomicrobiota bacterium]
MNTWKNSWLAAWFAAGVVCLGAAQLMAQQTDAEEDNQRQPGDDVVATATNTFETETVVETTDAGDSETTDRQWQRNARDIVVIGRSEELKAGDTVNAMVVIAGSATAHGKVNDSVVAIFGNATVTDEARDVVAVFGNVRIGTNANVRGDVVAVLGNVTIEDGANVNGDTVAVGGGVERAENATIGGGIVGFPGFKWIGEWLEQCVFKLRPLAPGLGWLWMIAGIFFVLYLLVALAFPRPVAACVNEIQDRPATTLLMGILTKVLVLPLVTLLLVLTGIGVFLVPFLAAAAMLAGIVGKVALLQYFGRRFGVQQPILAFVLGWVLLTLLFLVPILGMLVFAVSGMWALGAAVVALFGGVRRELPPSSPAPPQGNNPSGTAPTSTFAAAANVASPGIVATTVQQPSTAPVEPPESPHSSDAAATAAVSQGNVSEILALPRASFWERMAAAFLDIILVSILSAAVGGLPLGLLVAVAYFAGMWAWRGTTIGGIVLNLKVIRPDGRPVTFAVALVRSLMAAFSVIVLFLGFLWIAWDPDKQGWHDKIAGTVVVRLPKGAPLLML